MDIEERELTEQEADLYDRQIRLWGLDSQKRLKSSNVVLIGAGVFGIEIAKNILLAGIKSLTIIDDKKVSEEDILSGFMFNQGSLNKNRVDVIYEKAHSLNPMVELIVDASSFLEKEPDYFKQFTIICATECSAENIMYLNDISRKNNTLFMCGDVFGVFGYFFNDFITYEYSEDRIVQNESKKRDHVGNVIKTENKTVTEKKEITFIPFHDVLNLNNFDKVALKKITPWYFLLKILLSFRANYDRFPNYEERDVDIKNLIKIKENLNLDENKLGDYVFDMIFDVTVPTCSIVGGFLSQEIIKALSRKGAPTNNLFFFNFDECSGEIACISNKN